MNNKYSKKRYDLKYIEVEPVFKVGFTMKDFMTDKYPTTGVFSVMFSKMGKTTTQCVIFISGFPSIREGMVVGYGLATLNAEDNYIPIVGIKISFQYAVNSICARMEQENYELDKIDRFCERMWEKYLKWEGK